MTARDILMVAGLVAGGLAILGLGLGLVAVAIHERGAR